MTKLSRRALFPLAAAGAISAADGSQGASIASNGEPGLTIKIAKWSPDGWCALVPDFDSMRGLWTPGMAVPVKWVPLQEYLALVEKTFAMDQ